MKTSETPLPTEGDLVQFTQPGNGRTVGYCRTSASIPVYSPHNFDAYRADARLILKVVKGECTEEEALTLPEMALNAMGCNTLLAALVYEILEQESHL